jgi:guanylate kinase
MNIPHRARILVCIGPSGAGKSALVNELAKRGIVAVTPTWTDRPRRHGEVEIEHRFVSSKELDAEAAKGTFLHEPISFFGLPYRYATPRIQAPPHGTVPCVMGRVMALALMNRLYPNRVMYQVEASEMTLRRRVTEREMPEVQLGTRLSEHAAEISEGRQVAHRVFVNNGKLAACVDEVAEAIRADFKLSPKKL